MGLSRELNAQDSPKHRLTSFMFSWLYQKRGMGRALGGPTKAAYCFYLRAAALEKLEERLRGRVRGESGAALL